MPSLYILIPIAMIFCALAIRALFWALDNNQYKELDKEAHRILFDEDNSKVNNPDQAINKKNENID